MSKNLTIKETKAQLIDKLALFIEFQDKIAPTAARIYATLILTGKDGITFEELVIDLKASKSTICTHLQLLQDNGVATSFTKKGERKRYFVLAPGCISSVIDRMMNTWNDQKDIHENILNYKLLMNGKNIDNPPFEVEFEESYLAFLNETGNYFKKLKQKFNR